MKVTLIAFLALCLALVGCNHGGSVVGKWTGTMVADPGYENDPGFKMAEGFAKSISFDLKADKTFDGTMLLPVSGTYEVSGSTVTLTPKSVMGIDASKGNEGKADSKPMIATMAPDGKTMSMESNASSDQKASTSHYHMVLKREG